MKELRCPILNNVLLCSECVIDWILENVKHDCDITPSDVMLRVVQNNNRHQGRYYECCKINSAIWKMIIEVVCKAAGREQKNED